MSRLVVGLEEQPRILALARPLLHAHQMPLPVQLLAVEVELQVPLPVAEVGIEVGRPGASIPDHDGSAAILALRNHPFEAAVLKRMILDVDGQALLADNEARSLRNGPALEHAIHLEPEVVMQAPRRVFLNDEAVALGFSAALLS